MRLRALPDDEPPALHELLPLHLVPARDRRLVRANAMIETDRVELAGGGRRYPVNSGGKGSAAARNATSRSGATMRAPATRCALVPRVGTLLEPADPAGHPHLHDHKAALGGDPARHARGRRVLRQQEVLAPGKPETKRGIVQMKVRTSGLALALLATPLAHAIDDSAFARCRGIADTANRLACYDALPMNITPAATQAPPIAAPKAAPARPSSQPPNAQASTASPPAAPQQQAAAQSFGMENRAPEVELPTTMQARFPATSKAGQSAHQARQRAGVADHRRQPGVLQPG